MQQVSKLFLHLSDIHFGQERGGTLFVHNDVKERLIEDVSKVVASEFERPLAGIIVSGDTAYSGTAEEFKEAGKWLDRVAEAGRCKPTDVQIVPGNHDIDRKKISGAAAWMLDEIQKRGEEALDEFLAVDRDCELLYDRLSDYRTFAEGYGCPLDLSGGHAGDEFTFELGCNKVVRFLGLNSALTCSKNDKEGLLLLGAKQRVLRERAGETLVVLCHHPLNWLNDAADAWKYLRRSASVFISGHEHEPSVQLKSEAGHSDILLISAGATIPPKAEGPYNFAYYFLEFDWEGEADSLAVSVHSRCWDDERKRFGADQDAATQKSGKFLVTHHVGNAELQKPILEEQSIGLEETEEEIPKERVLLKMEEISANITLRFFRDLTANQRRQIFIERGLLPSDWSEKMKHSVETLLFRQLLSKGDAAELEMLIIKRIEEPGETS